MFVMRSPWIVVSIGVLCSLCFCSNMDAFSENGIRFTILYDNYVAEKGTEADWGFACLIQDREMTILFDAGSRSDILFRNAAQLKVDWEELDAIVISHDHGDHTGGLYAVLEKNPDVIVYMPRSFADKYRMEMGKERTRIVDVGDPVKVASGIHLTGEMGEYIKEQSLILETHEGLTIVTGCSHQGIVNILKRSREIIDKPIYLVFGGFHLMEHTDSQIRSIIAAFKKAGVQKCGATHCTGERQIELFRKAFDSDFMKMGTGRVFEFFH